MGEKGKGEGMRGKGIEEEGKGEGRRKKENTAVLRSVL